VTWVVVLSVEFLALVWTWPCFCGR